MARIAALVLVCGALVLGSALTVAQVGATTPSVVPTANCGPGPDTVPPQVIALRLNPDKVSVSQHSATVDVVAHAVDTMASQGGQAVPGSGVRQLQISLEGDRYAVEDADLHLSSGSAQNGVWRGRITIGRDEDASTWEVDQVIAVDAAGNSVVYPSSGGTHPIDPNDAIIQPHWEHSLIVSGRRRPETPVRLVAFHMSRLAVDTVREPEVLTVSARLAGPIEPRRTLGVGFDSAHTAVEFGAWLTHRSGENYTATIRVPRWLGDGKFHPSVFAYYFWDDFDARNVRGVKIQQSLTVTSRRDTTAPKLVGLTVTPTTVDTSQHRERISITARLVDRASGTTNGAYIYLHGHGGSTIVNLHKRQRRYLGRKRMGASMRRVRDMADRGRSAHRPQWQHAVLLATATARSRLPEHVRSDVQNW
jgi:hypothetical protein